MDRDTVTKDIQKGGRRSFSGALLFTPEDSEDGFPSTSHIAGTTGASPPDATRRQNSRPAGSDTAGNRRAPKRRRSVGGRVEEEYPGWESFEWRVLSLIHI